VFLRRPAPPASSFSRNFRVHGPAPGRREHVLLGTGGAPSEARLRRSPSERRSEMKKKLTLLVFALLSVTGALAVGVRSAEAGRCVTQFVDEGGGVTCTPRGADS